MDICEISQAIQNQDKIFWQKALQTRDIKPTIRHINRLKRHFFNWWHARRLGDFVTAWTSYAEDEEFASFIEACRQGRLSRSEVYILIWDGFGTLGVYKTSYRNEIRQIMTPLVAAGLVEHRVVRGGGHYWQPEHLKHMEFEEYLQMLMNVFLESTNPTQKAA